MASNTSTLAKKTARNKRNAKHDIRRMTKAVATQKLFRSHQSGRLLPPAETNSTTPYASPDSSR
jgi:hypothetical protein